MAGTTSRVTRVAKERQAEEDHGPHGHPALVPRPGEHQGTAPMMAVSEVIKMGRRRRTDP